MALKGNTLVFEKVWISLWEGGARISLSVKQEEIERLNEDGF